MQAGTRGQTLFLGSGDPGVKLCFLFSGGRSGVRSGSVEILRQHNSGPGADLHGVKPGEPGVKLGVQACMGTRGQTLFFVSSGSLSVKIEGSEISRQHELRTVS